MKSVHGLDDVDVEELTKSDETLANFQYMMAMLNKNIKKIYILSSVWCLVYEAAITWNHLLSFAFIMSAFQKKSNLRESYIQGGLFASQPFGKTFATLSLNAQ